jgi:phage tail sheath gpL-like
MSSIAVTLDRISRVVGYIIKKGTFTEDSPNLPQRIAVLAEANEPFQSTLSLLPVQITTAPQAAALYGDGSPIHMIARILFPFSGDGVGGVPVWVYPQAKAAGATAKLIKITPVGVATANVTHYVKVAGRAGIDGTFYAITLAAGDNAAQVAQKIEDAIQNCYGSPVKADADAYETILTSKWNGLTADGLTASVDTQGNAAGMTYTVTYPQAGAGTPSVSGALAQFGTDWNTIVVNSYGLETTTIQTLMAFNGVPDPTAPTGRFAGIIMKPFIAITGSTSDDPSATTDLYKNDVTIAVAPAPGSAGLPLEAAANMALLFAVQAQNSPHLDVAGKSYPDMPVSTTWSTATMSNYNSRDAIVKKGCSTVNLVAGAYQVQDFVTTYHLIGENPPQFRYCRNLNIDFNVRYGYYLLEIVNVVDHAIAADSDTVTADSIIKPKMWKSVLDEYATDLAQRALIVQPEFMQGSIVVNVGTTNPDRLETFFRYKRSGFARIASTTAEAGFNFGTLN